MAKAEIAAGSIETRSVDLGHHDAAQPVPTMRDVSDDVANSAPVTQDFRYLIYYVWSELPPPEKPADIVLSSLHDTPVGTPVEEIKRASDAFGLDVNFMKAVAKVESDFNPKQRTGSYIGRFRLSKDEFKQFGSGHILSPRDNAVAAAYKIITEGILFEWVTHKKPTLSDLYLIHQQGGKAPPSTSANLIVSLGNPCVPPAKEWRKAKSGANARSGGIPFRPSNTRGNRWIS